jgi:type VI protein secretion system component VasK
MSKKYYHMKQIKLIVFLLGMISFYASAQTQSSKSNAAANAGTSLQAKMDAVHSCSDLQNQLVRLFGESYSLNDKKVVSQLEKNINDKAASNCIRKSSLFAIYGNDYAKHLDRISQSPTSTSNK